MVHITTTPLIIDSHTAHITISIGIAASDATIYELNEVLKLADSALYKAKNAGRNHFKRQSLSQLSDSLRLLSSHQFLTKMHQ